MNVTVAPKAPYKLFWQVHIDGVCVGQGAEPECRALADELAGDESKAALVFSLFADKL
jgi:hypothetical protein